jgi:hypothetical protein
MDTSINPILPSVIERIKELFFSSKFKISRDPRIVFVCGASLASNSGKSARKRFLDYSVKHLVDYDIFIAEDFLISLLKNPEDDLLSIENKLGEYSDCIIIFLESPSAIAELGAFANHENLLGQMLVVNSIKFRDEDSFINRGPLKRIRKQSKFGEIIYCDFNSVLEKVTVIKKQLDDKKSNKKTIKIFNFNDYKSLDPKSKMLILLDFIALFQPVKLEELLFIYKAIIGNSYFEIDFEINLLMTLKYILKSDSNYYITCLPYKKPYFSFDRENIIPEIRAIVINAYQRKDKKRMQEYAGYR